MEGKIRGEIGETVRPCDLKHLYYIAVDMRVAQLT